MTHLSESCILPLLLSAEKNCAVLAQMSNIRLHNGPKKQNPPSDAIKLDLTNTKGSSESRCLCSNITSNALILSNWGLEMKQTGNVLLLLDTNLSIFNFCLGPFACLLASLLCFLSWRNNPTGAISICSANITNPET